MALLAGKFSNPPVCAQILNGGRVQFLDATNTLCWSDPNGRVLVGDVGSARLLLNAHGYTMGDARQDDLGRTFHIITSKNAGPPEPAPQEKPILNMDPEGVEAMAVRLDAAQMPDAAAMLRWLLHQREGLSLALAEALTPPNPQPVPPAPKGKGKQP